jgi:hypothetical protein
MTGCGNFAGLADKAARLSVATGRSKEAGARQRVIESGETSPAI